MRLTMNRLLAVIAAIAAFCGASAVAMPAFATNEYFPSSGNCYCENDNAPDNYIKNVYGINHSGHGNCTTEWQKNGNGTYSRVEESCVGSGETAYACIAGEVYGHGQVNDEGAGYNELRGRQDNLANCGE